MQKEKSIDIKMNFNKISFKDKWYKWEEKKL